MAKTTQNKKLYKRMRASGVRKKIARQFSELPGHVSGGRAPKPLRDAVDRLEAAVVELKDHSGGATARRRPARRRGLGVRRPGAAAALPARVPGDGPRRSRQDRDRRDKSEATERCQERSHQVGYSVSGASAISACSRAQSTSHGSPPRLVKPHSTWRLLKRAFSVLDSPGKPRGSGRDRCTSARGPSCRPSALPRQTVTLTRLGPSGTRSVRASPPRRRRVRRGGRRRRRVPGRRAR